MSRFRVKPHTEPRKPRTQAQEAATDRAFRIFRLRGLYYQALLLTGERREQAQAAVDAELRLLGAKTHAEHAAEVAEHLAAEPHPDDFAELPF
ncbi:MAG: hypothetical protein Q7J28_02640 [Caulobacter sp.]|nr:hypothetical protein [Caulobacter sp.]